MPIQFSNDKPIFMQLANMIKSDIIGGKFKPNDKLPSVREFALEFGVNPNTVQKALQLLEDDGLITTDRTNGKFVANNPNKIKTQKEKMLCKLQCIFGFILLFAYYYYRNLCSFFGGDFYRNRVSSCSFYVGL